MRGVSYIHLLLFGRKKREKIKMVSELSEQIFLAKKLKAAGILFCAVPNGGYRQKKEAGNLKASGVVPGVPDLLIFDVPPGELGKVGCAVEMKREGGKRGSVSEAQREWLQWLEDRNWVSLVGFGWRDAVEKLQALGYRV